MLKLLQINSSSNIYSTGKIVESIGGVATSNGWECYVAYGRYSKLSKYNNEIIIGNVVNPYLHYLEFRIFDDEGMGSRYATKILIRKIEKIKPDVVHLHNIHGHYINFPILFDYFKKVKVPVVWTQHDCWSFTGGCMYYDLFECEQWKTGCKLCKNKRALINKSERNFCLKKKAFLMNNITLVPVSHWLANSIKHSFLSEVPIITIHNGIDLSVFKPREKEISNKYNILGVAAVWDKRKGLDDFYKIRTLLPDYYSITLVGLSEKQLKDLPTDIIGISKTSSADELVDLYNSADVFVNPTYSDNFPTTNIEALACGIPVITYNTGGSPEAIDKNTGIVVPQGNIQELCSAIIYSREHRFHSKDCRNRAESYFDDKKCFDSYIQLYNHIVEKKK